MSTTNRVPTSNRQRTQWRRGFLAMLFAGALGTAWTTRAQAGQKKTFKYRCPKCKLVQEYVSPGAKKCPNDGRTMIRMN